MGPAPGGRSGPSAQLLGLEPVLAEGLGEPVPARLTRLRRHPEEVGHAGARRVVAVLQMGPEGEELVPEPALFGRQGHDGMVPGNVESVDDDSARTTLDPGTYRMTILGSRPHVTPGDWKLVRAEGDCLLWTRVLRNGYGTFRRNGKIICPIDSSTKPSSAQSPRIL